MGKSANKPTQESEMPSMSVGSFYQLVQQPNDLVLLDVRNHQEFQESPIDVLCQPTVHNLPYIDFVVDERKALKQLSKNHQYVVVCRIGNASQYVTNILTRSGYSAADLEGGVLAWNQHYVFRPIVENAQYQIYQVERVARGCLSYIIISDNKAIIIDPLRHIDNYLQFLTAKRAKLEFVIDTHGHADHISGGSALGKAADVPYYLHPYDAVHYTDAMPANLSYTMLKDNKVFVLGVLTLQAVHMPGHTLGQINILVKDSGDTTFLLTGDTLFLQGFGCPELIDHGDAWAKLAYQTLYTKFKEIAQSDTVILPGHYAQANEINEQGVIARSAEDLWNTNASLHFDSPASFSDYVDALRTIIPPEYADVRRVNLGLLELTEAQLRKMERGKNICAVRGRAHG